MNSGTFLRSVLRGTGCVRFSFLIFQYKICNSPLHLFLKILLIEQILTTNQKNCYINYTYHCIQLFFVANHQSPGDGKYQDLYNSIHGMLYKYSDKFVNSPTTRSHHVSADMYTALLHPNPPYAYPLQ